MKKSKKLTDQEKRIIYRAAEGVAESNWRFSCTAILIAANRRDAIKLVIRYNNFYQKPSGPWPGLMWSNKISFSKMDAARGWRLMLLAWFAEVEGEL